MRMRRLNIAITKKAGVRLFHKKLFVSRKD